MIFHMCMGFIQILQFPPKTCLGMLIYPWVGMSVGMVLFSGLVIQGVYPTSGRVFSTANRRTPSSFSMLMLMIDNEDRLVPANQDTPSTTDAH